MTTSNRLILLTGASGYIGGRVLCALEHRGEAVRCLSRQPEFLRYRVGPNTEVVRGDIFDAESFRAALEGVQVAYYLVHSLGARGHYAEADRLSAGVFSRVAHGAGVRRLVYLGALGEPHRSAHYLRSRQEVGHMLRESGVLTVEFRAPPVVGSGSLAFEMVRALVEKRRRVLLPRWARLAAQWIGIEDLTAYLVGALDLDGEDSELLEIGGADARSFADLVRAYALHRELRLRSLRVPFHVPRFSGAWLGSVTPIYARVVRELVAWIRSEPIVRDDAALRRFAIRPRALQQTVRRAEANEDYALAQTRWSGAVSSTGGLPQWGRVRFGSRILDARSVRLPVDPRHAFAPVRRIGGEAGWYYGNWLWRLRGLMDLCVGGPGLRRGRRDPEHVAPGDALDFWRVEAMEEDRLLRLQAEMKLPGRAWLQFEVEPVEGGVRVYQTALFDPVGLAGLAYWYLLYPTHVFVFRGMLRGIARRALAEAGAEGPIRIRHAR